MSVTVLLCGTGGYGRLYLEEVLTNGALHDTELLAAVEPYLTQEAIEALGKRPCYNTLEEALTHHQPDLVIVSTPIQFHVPQVKLALAHGCHVLCEKPLAATIQDCRELIEARNAAGRIAAVGFQWSYAQAMLAAKRDILDGVYGKPVSLKARVLWPRTAEYYARGGGWAGKIQDGQGRTILDSVASNATAHYLFNMLFLLGDSLESAAQPDTLTAGLYRANPIETFDTSFIQMKAAGADIHYYASHAVPADVHPAFEYHFEKGSITFDSKQRLGTSQVTGHIDNRTVEYGDPYQNELRKIWVMVNAVRGGAAPTCTLEAAMQHVVAVNAAHTSMTPRNFPTELVYKEGSLTWVDGLSELMLSCYQDNRMPEGECGCEMGKTVACNTLQTFTV